MLVAVQVHHQLPQSLLHGSEWFLPGGRGLSETPPTPADEAEEVGRREVRGWGRLVCCCDCLRLAEPAQQTLHTSYSAASRSPQPPLSLEAGVSIFLSLIVRSANECKVRRACECASGPIDLQRCCWKMMLLSLHPNIIVYVEKCS